MAIRNIPLFGLVALPLVVLHFAGGAVAWRSPLLARLRAGFAEAARSVSPGAWSAGAAGLIVIAAAARLAPGGRPLVQAGFDPTAFPVEAVARARAAGLSGPVFNEFAWGGYLLYAWPEQRVFIDGQTDFYGEQLTREYATIRETGAGWQEALARRGVELMLLPPDAPLVQALSRSPSWKMQHLDATAVLLQHQPTRRDRTP
jgi:hypothetical protein